MSKEFKFDVILSEDDMCGRRVEMQRLLSLMRRHGRMVVYSMRRMGKTSLISVCGKKLKEEDSHTFYLYVDLNEVASLGEVAGRLRSHYELALKEQFPIQKVKSYLNALLAKVKINIPGGLELSLEHLAEKQSEKYLISLFGEINEMTAKNNVVVVIDEFQGIVNLKDAQAILRREFQKLSNASIILMGSNQRLLYKIFNDKNLPFFGFGEDLELGKIALKDYLPYLNERFSEKNLAISEEIAAYMMEKMNDIPNYINELGAWIVDTMSGAELTQGHIDEALETLVRSKRGRYTSALYGYNGNQKKFIKAVARIGGVKAYSGKEMQELTQLSASELVRVKDDLDDCPLLSLNTDNQLFVPDPFLRKFLGMM